MLIGLFGTAALACGGFFCDNAAPVDQAGERIVFAVGEAGTEMHVQVKYDGPSEDFSWLLPVPSLPELLLSADDLFVRLGQVTAPSYAPSFDTVGTCASRGGGAKDDSPPTNDTDGGGGVSVVVEQQLGPYDAQILTATDVVSLTTWLVENDYDVYPGSEAKLGVYVQEGGYFVGLKLRKDRGNGDLAPIALRFAGDEPIIPLQLTAVAATDDMPVQPFILGAARAVPENYLHVTLNPFAVDWLNRGSNYAAVVSRAADEAGGQAFATDFAGRLSGLRVTTWAEGQYPIEAIASVADSHQLAAYLAVPFFFSPSDTDWMAQPGVLPVSTGTSPILARFVTKPGDYEADDTAYLNCLDCFRQVPVDGAALAAALAAEWVEPMRGAQAMLDRHAWLTRMTSSLSAGEMTLDPRFVLNSDLPAVSNVHAAVIRTLCNPTRRFERAPRELELEDGRVMELPSQEAWAEQGWTWEAWTEVVGQHAAETVEQMGRSGAPIMVTDNRAAIDAALKGLHVRGCGCDGAGGAAGWIGLGVVLGWRRRRSPVGEGVAGLR